MNRYVDRFLSTAGHTAEVTIPEPGGPATLTCRECGWSGGDFARTNRRDAALWRAWRERHLNVLPAAGLNVAELYNALDMQRDARGVTWRDVASETGVDASVFSRMAGGGAPTAHSLVKMLVWLDVKDISGFVARGKL